jgi:hypothetical protein
MSLESWMKKETEETEEALAAAHAQLGEEQFAEAWAAGATMSLDDAVTLALGHDT